jgi:deoxycytidine triphosphate deaminase
MAKILSDRDVRQLLGTVVNSGDARLLNPNGIELRLGSSVKFLSTSEMRTIQEGDFLKVGSGESVLVSSLERLDFSESAIQKVMPKKMLMGLISPTTTMMREGISQVTTKVDSGFKGQLNWMIRNSSSRDLILKYGEPIFKLTIFELEGTELPDVKYGDKADHKYQNSEGIVPSARQLPVDIPKERIVSSSRDKLDAKRQLREAGYPFDHISSELVQLDGKFEMVSREVAGLTKEIETRTGAIKERTDTILVKLQESQQKMEDNRKGLEEHAEHLFSKKFNAVVGILIGAITTIYGLSVFLQKLKTNQVLTGALAVVAGIAILAITLILTRRAK